MSQCQAGLVARRLTAGISNETGLRSRTMPYGQGYDFAIIIH